nr:3'-5' exonuclease [Nocardiopsis algeriensis]
MHRFKGLEYQHMAIAAVSEGLVPRAELEGLREGDPDRYRHELQKARSTLFVAATRARDSLVVSWHGDPSPLLPSKAVADSAEGADQDTKETEVEDGGFEDGGLFKPPGALI